MRVLIGSPAFHPQVGGLEEVVAMVAEELHRTGHEVRVVCAVAHDGPEPFPFDVVRRPGRLELLRLFRWSEVFVQANVALKQLWPLALVRRPWVVSHHSWYRQPDGTLSLRDRLKRRLLCHADASVAVSRAMADDLERGPERTGPTRVIENPYRDGLFRVLADEERSRDLIFLGRLVSDKGCDLLLDAMARLPEGLAPSLTIVGRGPEEPRLRKRTEELGLADRVRFAGTVTGEDLVLLLNRHRILVAPSRYNEPFGLVALEGLACGCQVIGSAGGGLPDAIGPGGWTFPNNDVDALTRLLARALGGELPLPDAEAVRTHLKHHSKRAVGELYAGLLQEVAIGAAGARGPAPDRSGDIKDGAGPEAPRGRRP